MKYEVVGVHESSRQAYVGTVGADSDAAARQAASVGGIRVTSVRPTAKALVYASRYDRPPRRETDCLTLLELAVMWTCRFLAGAAILYGIVLMLGTYSPAWAVSDMKLKPMYGLTMVLCGVVLSLVSAVVRGRATLRWTCRRWAGEEQRPA